MRWYFRSDYLRASQSMCLIHQHHKFACNLRFDGQRGHALLDLLPACIRAWFDDGWFDVVRFDVAS